MLNGGTGTPDSQQPGVKKINIYGKFHIPNQIGTENEILVK